MEGTSSLTQVSLQEDVLTEEAAGACRAAGYFTANLIELLHRVVSYSTPTLSGPRPF